MEPQAIQLSLFPDLVPIAPVKKGKKQTAAGTQLSLFSTEQWGDIVAPHRFHNLTLRTGNCWTVLLSRS